MSYILRTDCFAGRPLQTIFLIFLMMMKMISKHIYGVISLSVSICFCASCNIGMTMDSEAASQFVLVANADGNEATRVSASYANNAISFVWSETDSLFVTFFPINDEQSMTDEIVGELPTYIFHLKKGAGEKKATFICDDFNPSDFLVDGRQYVAFAVYNPYFGDGSFWTHEGGELYAYTMVPVNLNYSADEPMELISQYDAMGGRGLLSSNNTLEIKLVHTICVLKVIVKNTGLNSMTISGIDFPSSDIRSLISSDLSYSGGRYYGEALGHLVCDPLIDLEPGESYVFYIPMEPLCWYADHNDSPVFFFYLSNGKQIRINRSFVGSFFDFEAGKIYQTTFNLDSGSAVSKDIPDIGGSGKDDF